MIEYWCILTPLSWTIKETISLMNYKVTIYTTSVTKQRYLLRGGHCLHKLCENCTTKIEGIQSFPNLFLFLSCTFIC